MFCAEIALSDVPLMATFVKELTDEEKLSSSFYAYIQIHI